MRVVIALFIVCAIAVACGKKINPIVTSEMDLAILRDDGAIFEDHSARKFELNAGTGESSKKKTPAAKLDFNVHLRENQIQNRSESEVAMDLFEATPERALIGSFIFKMVGTRISQYPMLSQHCELRGAATKAAHTASEPTPTCQILSVILNKEQVDPLGNKTRVFKQVSANYADDHQGISSCDLTLDASQVKYNEASYAGPDGNPVPGETYKYALLTSQNASEIKPSSLTLTCYKNVATGGAKPELRSVFRGVFKQTRTQ